MKGRVQSCGATETWCVSASVAILRASLSPPVQMIGHDDMGGIGVEDAVLGVACEKSLAHRLRDARLAHRSREVWRTVRLDKIFHPHQVPGLDGARDV